MRRLVASILIAIVATSGSVPVLGANTKDVRGAARASRNVFECDPEEASFAQRIFVNMVGEFRFGGRIMRGQADVALDRDCVGTSPGPWNEGGVSGTGVGQELWGACWFESESLTRLAGDPPVEAISYAVTFSCRARIRTATMGWGPYGWGRFLVKTVGATAHPCPFIPVPATGCDPEDDPVGAVWEGVGVYLRS